MEQKKRLNKKINRLKYSLMTYHEHNDSREMEPPAALKWPMNEWGTRERVEREGGGANEEKERVSRGLTCWFNITNGFSICNDLMKWSGSILSADFLFIII